MTPEPPAQTNATRVASELRDAIIEGELAPNQRLRAEALASRFGISRTPIREALIILEREGLVELAPNRGAIVRSFDAADLIDLYQLRTVLEPYGAACAAERIADGQLRRLRELCDLSEARDGGSREAVEAQMALNEEFHGIIVEAAGSPRLLAAMQGVAGIPRVFRSTFWRTDEQRSRSLYCHREILYALEHHRPETARAAMRLHMQQALEFLIDMMPKDGLQGGRADG
jgi:DNA-binding GntR family transcriptional regulator